MVHSATTGSSRSPPRGEVLALRETDGTQSVLRTDGPQWGWTVDHGQGVEVYPEATIDDPVETTAMHVTNHHKTSEERTSIEQIIDHELPPEIDELVTEYDEHIGHRDEFLWKWLHVVLPHVTLSSVAPEFERQVRDTKTIASMYVVLLDDVGEIDRDKPTLDQASRIPFESVALDGDRGEIDRDSLEVATCIWNRVEESFDVAPRGQEFADVMAFDLKQTLNAIDYSYLVNENLEMANLEESWRFDCYNMMLFTYMNVDLMFSPSFDRADWGRLREAVGKAQQMARIGNWITTWEREIAEGDFSSGVVTYALDQRIVTTSELEALRTNADPSVADGIVRKIDAHDVERQFLELWERIYHDAKALESDVQSVDLSAYFEGMETVMEFHVESRGLK